MARSFLRGGTWGKLFSAVDGCFILSPTAHFSQRQFPFFLSLTGDFLLLLAESHPSETGKEKLLGKVCRRRHVFYPKPGY